MNPIRDTIDETWPYPGLIGLRGWNGMVAYKTRRSGSPDSLGGSSFPLIARQTVAAVGARPGPSSPAPIFDASIICVWRPRSLYDP